MKQMLKLGLILAAYTAVACVCLALVNNVTSPTIAALKQAQLEEGLKVVFADADSFSVPEGFSSSVIDGVTIEDVYIAKKGDAVIGAIAKATGPTYDKATLLVGVNRDKKVEAISFLSITDTPGFGQKATEPVFYNQYAGKAITDEFATKKDITPISGATITTNGVSAIVKIAANAAATYLQ
ncbi:MAG: FMN-binding protein [Spirochaetaceae bacterium]|nr:FMN-binding protein [Spirochaetaceae bacterium]